MNGIIKGLTGNIGDDQKKIRKDKKREKGQKWFKMKLKKVGQKNGMKIIR